jgi:hypothetical protein
LTSYLKKMTKLKEGIRVFVYGVTSTTYMYNILFRIRNVKQTNSELSIQKGFITHKRKFNLVGRPKEI